MAFCCCFGPFTFVSTRAPSSKKQPSLRPDEKESEHDARVEKVRNILCNLGMDSLGELIMIDALHRLGISYHFIEEIKTALYTQYVKRRCPYEEDSHDLMEVALRFRLLRNEGYVIDANLFDKFKGSEGRFKDELSEDTAALMSLYEASQLRMRGEDILDEAHEFSNQQLRRASMNNLNHQHESKLIDYTLKYPYHKSWIPSLLSPIFLETSNVNQGWMKDLQDLSKMEYDMVQMRIQNEVLQISKWWTDLGLSKELEFARIQPLKWYMWPLAALPEPLLSIQRVELTKSISLVYIIDDIFDVYGTLDELTIFTEAINRRELAILEELPECMNLCFKCLNDIINQSSNRTFEKYGWNPTDTLWKVWADLCNAFLVEGRWFASGEFPSTEEYLKNGTISTGVHVVLAHLFILLGEEINHENLELLNRNELCTPLATILRLQDDLGNAKDENQDGHDGSIIVYYMNEHYGSSIEDARNYVTNRISYAWKQLTEECLLSPRFSTTFCDACIKFARMVSLVHNNDDKNGNSSVENHMKSLLYECVHL